MKRAMVVILLLCVGCAGTETVPEENHGDPASIYTSEAPPAQPQPHGDPQEQPEAEVETDPEPSVAEEEADELPDLGPILREVERIRGLEFKKDVPAAVQSLDEFGAMVEAELERGFPADTRDAVMGGLVRLGILEQPIDLGEGMKNALLSQAAAYYDPTTDRFYYLMADLPPEMMDVTAAHELVHALQDQHFDLDAMVKAMEEAALEDVRDDDKVLALRFLVEGEATYVMTHWQMKKQMGMDLSTVPPAMEEMSFKTMANMSIQQLITMSSAQAEFLEEGSAMRDAAESMKAIPPYILGPLFQAYMGGAYFTMKVKHQNGWEGISDLYRDLPQSSEQTLHPEKYLSNRDHPSEIRFPEFRALGDWTRADAAIHGEYYMTLLLEQAGHSNAKQVAAGWDGDLYHAYQKDGEFLVVLATTWDSEAEAMEFFGAWRDTRKKRFKGLVVDSASTSDVHAYDCGGKFGHGRLVRRGSEVFVIEGGDARTCDAILAELQDVEIERR